MLSREVLDYTLALHSKLILQDYRLMRPFLSSKKVELPKQKDRRALYWLVDVCAAFQRKYMSEGYRETLPEDLRIALESKDFQHGLKTFRDVDKRMIDPRVTKQIRSFKGRV